MPEPIRTSFTRLVGIDYPIVQAGMSWVSSSPVLPAAVSQAGGLGVFAAGPVRIGDLGGIMSQIRTLTDKPWAVNLPLYRKDSEQARRVILEARPDVLIASQGGPSRYLADFRSVGTICLHVVASVEHALKAAEAGVDGLVVVGGEAGGHPPHDLVSTMVLTRAVATAVPELPIVASGGFADGQGLVAALSLGASAAQFGTRFIASDEAQVHDDYRAMVLAAGVGGTRTVGRDLGMIRCLQNDFTDQMQNLENSGATLEARRSFFGATVLRQAAMDGHVTSGKVEAGQSAGLVRDVASAREIVHRIADEYRLTTARLPR
jgi:Dioxygenases related to 2-nitropropane dioxygenase